MSLEKTTEAARGRWREKSHTAKEPHTAFAKLLDGHFLPETISTSLPIVMVSLPCHGVNDGFRVCSQGSASLDRAAKGSKRADGPSRNRAFGERCV
jgi:hypothetical protein